MDRTHIIIVLLLTVSLLILLACTPSPLEPVHAPESLTPGETLVKTEETAESSTNILPEATTPEPIGESTLGTTGSSVETEAMQKPTVDQPQTTVSTRPTDSPWPMFHGNLQHTGLSPYDTSHIGGTEKWSFETRDGIESSPAIGVDGTIYVGSHDGYLYAVNPDGTEKWRFDAGPPSYDERWKVSKSIMASPAIASDGTIYIYSAANYLFAINADGIEKWRFYVKWHNDFWSSPTVGPDGTIYIGSARSQGDPDYEGGLHAINPDGTEKWLFSNDSGVTSSAAIGTDGTIYFGGNVLNPHGEGNIGKLYALNPDGTMRWEFTTENWMESSPAIGSDGIIYIGSGREGKIYAINPDGTEKWRFQVEVGVSAVPAIGADGTIYIGAWDCNFYALNPDGSEKWRFKNPDAFEGVSSSAAIDSDGTIYVGSNSGNFYAFNPDGIVKWNFQTYGSGIVTSPAIDWDGTIYFGSWNHKLYAIDGSLARESSEGTISDKVGATTTSGGPESPFTVSPVDIDRINSIIPLGNLNPPAHVFPTDHMYFYMTNPTHSAMLYSPGDLTITSITAQEHVTAGFTDYTILLKVSDDVTVEFGHVKSLSKDVFGDTSSYKDWKLNNEYSTGGEDYRLWTKNVEIKVTAGEILGTVAENRWGTWDFWVFDRRFSPNNVANPERWQRRRSLQAVDFLSYYEEGPVLDQLVALVERDKVAGDTTPYGTVMQDVPGTAQGVWFLAGVNSSSPEDPHLALVHSNIHPDRAVLSVGSSIPSIGSGVYEFLPKSQGLLNRDFPAITPDKQIYGFQITEHYGKGFAGIIIVTMPDTETLWIEGRRGASPAPTSWTFTKNKAVFVR